MSQLRDLPPALDRQEAAHLEAFRRSPVALTGATGFIGSHVAEALLDAGVSVRGLVRDPDRLAPQLRGRLEAVHGDLNDRSALESLFDGVAVVVHLAGRVRASRAGQFDEANRVGTENLVAGLVRADRTARLVHVSSLAAAGPSPLPEGIEPTAPAAPVSAYGRSKLGAERAVAASGLPWTILRPPIVYGPRDIDVFQFFRLAARGIVPLPAGERYATVTYVTDVVRAVAAAMSGVAEGKVLHLGEPRPWRFEDLVRAIAEAGGVRTRIVRVPPPVIRLAGATGNVLQRLGFGNVAMTADKATEMLARHWTARTASSLAALGIDGCVPLTQGAEAAWRWYRDEGWLPHAKIAGA